MDIKTKSLPGLYLSSLHRNSTDLVVLKLAFRHNLANTPENNLLLALYGDLLLAGTNRKDRSTLTNTLNEAGIDITISSGEGVTNLTLTVLKSELKTALSLLREIMLEPAFKETEVKRAKTTLKNNLDLAKDNAKQIAHDLLRRELFKVGSPTYGYLPENYEPLVDKTKRSALLKLHDTILTSEYIVTVGGDANNIAVLEKLVNELRERVSLHPNNQLTENLPLEIKQTKLVAREIASKQNLELSIGASVPLRLDDTDYCAFLFGLHVLGHWGGFAGRLMSTVREKEGLTYGIYAKLEAINLQRTGYWRVMTFFAPKDVKRGIASTRREIKAIAEKGITESEWKRFHNIIRTSEALIEDTFTGQVNLAHGNALAGLSPDAYRELKHRLKNVKRAEVNQALKKYLRPEQLVICLTGPTKAIPGGVAKLLK